MCKTNSVNNSSLTIYAPARVHFGLFSIAEENGLRFGGAGLMVKAPATVIKAIPNGQLKFTEAEELLRKNASLWWKQNQHLLPDTDQFEDLPVKLTLQSQPPRHSGFGSGTQIAMAVAVALFKFFDLKTPNATTLATAMQRGKRSAIGTYGFHQGGFLVDKGISKESMISEFEMRMDVPTDWRIVLLIPKTEQGIHGPLENKTFDQLVDNVKVQQRDQLTRLCYDLIVPAIKNNRYDQLGGPLREFNQLSGRYFSEYQYGLSLIHI